MRFFDRFWELNIKSNPATQTDFDYTIKQDDFGNSLRLSFDITATLDVRYYSGTIKIYNLDPDKKRNLVFNRLLEDFGTGPAIKLVAGYAERSGLIMDGVIQRGYTIREPTTGDWITVLQCGLPFKNDEIITIQSQQVKNDTLLTFITNVLTLILPEGTGVDEKNRFKIKRAKTFNDNLSNAVTVFTDANTVNKAIGYSGPKAKILNEISNEFNLEFFFDNEGFNVEPAIIEDADPEFEVSEETGMLSSPIYTDTGAKVLNYLRPEFRTFQPVRVKSDVLDKKVKIIQLNHRGDTHSDEWYSEFDASNIGQIIRS